MNAVNTAFDNGYAAGRDDARRRAELVVSERDAEITRLRAEVEQYKQDAKRYFWLRQRGRTPPIENVITITVPDPMRGGLDFAVDACVREEAAALGGGEG